MMMMMMKKKNNVKLKRLKFISYICFMKITEEKRTIYKKTSV